MFEYKTDEDQQKQNLCAILRVLQLEAGLYGTHQIFL